jgi:asparagine synthase (glutamine-hydrolysing)
VSGFAAIFRFDGAPASGAALERMVEAIAYRGPDGIERWSDDGAAIAHLMLRTTAESLEETQPLASDDGSLVLVMDGWLANYEELRSDLLAHGCRLRTRADAELVLRAYETWGDDCPKYIDGEYAFVVWDARRREAFCARDHAGLRPLHYHWDGKRLLVASDLAGVLAAGDFEHRPNRGMIAEHLANEWYSREETLWEGVLRLPPAHAMRDSVEGVLLARHWLPNPNDRLRYASDADYRAHYRALFEDSVRRCSRTHRPLACDVSGGHDSSAVFGVAERLRREGRLLAPALAGYTFYFGPDCPPEADEIAYARAVGEHLGVTIREVPPFTADFAWYADTFRAEGDISTYPNVAMLRGLGEAMVADGSRVALNGHGGDEFLAVPPFSFAEHVAELDWRGFALSWRDDSRAYGANRALWRALRFGIGPNLPRAVRTWRRHAARRWGQRPLEHALLPPDMQRLLAERREAYEQAQHEVATNASQRGMLARINDPFAPYMHDYLARLSARLGYEARSPMHARALIEFALAIPDRQRRRGDRQKFIHLSSLANDLPEVVRERRGKCTVDHLFEQALDSALPSVLTRLLHCGIDWINPPGLVSLVQQYNRAAVGRKPVYELWAAVGCGTLLANCDFKTH